MSAHLTINSLTLKNENNIHLISLPPTSTNLIQPVDVGYFSSLNTYWRGTLSSWRETKQGKAALVC